MNVADDKPLSSQFPVVENAAASEVIPFSKWPGGKRWLVSSWSELLPKRTSDILSPFLCQDQYFSTLGHLLLC